MRAFTRYTSSKVAQVAEDKVYRDYLTEAMRMLTKSNADIAGQGSYFGVRYHDLIHPQPEDNRTGEEIKQHILGKLRGGAG